MTPAASALVVEHREFARRYALRLARVCAVQEHADDAVSEAMMGLIEAAQRFDPERVFRFGTYAKFWIRNRVLLFIARNKYALRQTNTHRVTALAIRMARIRTGLAGRLGRKPDSDDYAAALGVTVEEVDEARQSMRVRDHYVEHHDVFELGHGYIFETSRVHPDEANPEDAYAAAEEQHAQRQTIEGALEGLSERDADIVRRRLLGDVILEELAAEYGITRERVRQIQAQHQPRVEARLRKMARGMVA